MTIGLQRGITKLVPWSAEWGKEFEVEKERLISALGNHIIDIQHIGSTSIKDMPAKPIIDIVLAVSSFSDAESLKSKMLELGYTHRGPQGVADRELFVKGQENNRTDYVHVTAKDSKTWNDEILFRDYLNSHPEQAEAYANLKKELAQKYPNERQKYTRNKAAFIQKIIRLAKN